LFNFFVSALFLRAALFLWIRPLVAARSTVFTASLYALSADSRSLPETAASNFFILVFISDFAALFFAVAFCVSRTLFDEDFMFGISCSPPPSFITEVPQLTSIRTFTNLHQVLRGKLFYHLIAANAIVFSKSHNNAFIVGIKGNGATGRDNEYFLEIEYPFYDA